MTLPNSPTKRRRGNTFVEIMVSVLLVLIIVGTVFSVPLTSRRAMMKTDQKVAAALAGKQVLETLKSYVTADTAASPGPGAAPNGWGLPGDNCECYALSPGAHDLAASVWFPQFAGPPFNASISYTILDSMSVGGSLPDVTLRIDWSSP